MLVSIGLISYPLYLWHWPILTFTRLLTVETPAPLARVFALATSVLLAWMTYLLIERPIRFGGNRNIKAVALTASMICVGCLGYDCYRQNGQPFHKQIDSISRMYQVADLPHDAECDIRFPQFAVFHQCRLSKPSSAPEVVIIGDSHAGQYFSNLAKAFPDKVVMNIVQQACLPFATYVSPECSQHLNVTYSFIEKQSSIRTVYLAGYWAHLMVGGFAKELVGGGILRSLNYVDVKTFQTLGHSLISDLIRSGKEVIFIYDEPDLDFGPLSCLDYRPIHFLEKIRTPCALERDVFQKRNADYERVIAEFTSQIPGLKFFDPKEVLCDQDRCWAMRDGRLLYRDRHHLSDFGAATVVKRMVAELRRFQCDGEFPHTQTS
jgi:hypothetical protein